MAAPQFKQASSHPLSGVKGTVWSFGCLLTSQIQRGGPPAYRPLRSTVMFCWVSFICLEILEVFPITFVFVFSFCVSQCPAFFKNFHDFLDLYENYNTLYATTEVSFVQFLCLTICSKHHSPANLSIQILNVTQHCLHGKFINEWWSYGWIRYWDRGQKSQQKMKLEATQQQHPRSVFLHDARERERWSAPSMCRSIRSDET